MTSTSPPTSLQCKLCRKPITFDNKHVGRITGNKIPLDVDIGELVKSGQQKFRYIDAIYDYKNIIEELQKLYMQTPVADRFIRDRIHSEMNEAQKDLAKTQAEYDSSRNTRQKLQ